MSNPEADGDGKAPDAAKEGPTSRDIAARKTSDSKSGTRRSGPSSRRVAKATGRRTGPSSDWDVRRQAALAVSIVMLIASLAAWQFSSSSSGTFVAAACGRIGLVLLALWLAWPSLKRPAKWLPAGAPVIGVIALIVVAAQPRLLIPAIPIVGLLITVSGFARAFRGKGGPPAKR